VLPASAQGWHNKQCGWISSPKIEDGARFELDAWGHVGPLPACRTVRRVANSVPRNLPPGPWGPVGSWTCQWSGHEGVVCKRHGNWFEEVTPGGD
jgi:hypothetical protein